MLPALQYRASRIPVLRKTRGPEVQKYRLPRHRPTLSLASYGSCRAPTDAYLGSEQYVRPRYCSLRLYAPVRSTRGRVLTAAYCFVCALHTRVSCTASANLGVTLRTVSLLIFIQNISYNSDHVVAAAAAPVLKTRTMHNTQKKQAHQRPLDHSGYTASSSRTWLSRSFLDLFCLLRSRVFL